MQISLKQLETITKDKNVLYVTNKKSFLKNGLDKTLKTNDSVIYNNFSLNPKLTDIKIACETLHNEQFDFVIGVGGGSAMDFAKSLHYFLELKLESEIDYLEHINAPHPAHINSELILIPTTAGSGSEATHFSVVYDDKVKYSFSHEALRAKYIVLDPQFTKDLPPNITAYTGMDAIVHAIESYWAKAATTESKEYALNALRLLVPHIKEATFSPTNLSRMAMLEGSYLAGKAIDISKTTAAHAFSYYLTTHFDIPHGKAVCNMLSYFLVANGEYPELNQIFKVKNNLELKEAFVKLLKELELYFNPFEMVNDLDDFIDAVNLQRLENNPVSFSQEQLETLFTQ